MGEPALTTRKTLLSTTLLTAMIALGAATAQAAGYALLEQSAESQGTSHAGSAARTDDPSVLFYNPAGMVKLNGYQFSINTTYIDPQATLQSGSATTNVPGAQVPVRGDVGHDAAVDGPHPGDLRHRPGGAGMACRPVGHLAVWADDEIRFRLDRALLRADLVAAHDGRRPIGGLAADPATRPRRLADRRDGERALQQRDRFRHDRRGPRPCAFRVAAGRCRWHGDREGQRQPRSATSSARCTTPRPPPISA